MRTLPPKLTTAKSISDLNLLLQEFTHLKLSSPTGPTLLDIARFPKYENVWSRILGFYLNPNNEHQLGSTVLNAFLECIEAGQLSITENSLTVTPEFHTSNGNRIDLLIECDNFIIGIENKVDAGLYNDLEDYSRTIDDVAGGLGIPTYKVVLSKNRIITNNGFRNVTYTTFFNSLENRLSQMQLPNSKYSTFLLDFIHHTRKVIKGNTMIDQEALQFLKQNSSAVSRLIKLNEKANAALIEKMNEVDKLMGLPSLRQEWNLAELNIVITGFDSIRDTGRFIWKGDQLIKFCLKAKDITFWYQVKIDDYRLNTHYWCQDKKHSYILKQFSEKGIRERHFDLSTDSTDIAMSIREDLGNIISTIKDLNTKETINGKKD